MSFVRIQNTNKDKDEVNCELSNLPIANFKK